MQKLFIICVGDDADAGRTDGNAIGCPRDGLSRAVEPAVAAADERHGIGTARGPASRSRVHKHMNRESQSPARWVSLHVSSCHAMPLACPPAHGFSWQY